MKVLCVLIAGTSVAAATVEAANDLAAELERCAAVRAESERLECYDRLAAATAQVTTQPAAPAPAATASPTPTGNSAKAESEFGARAELVTRPEKLEELHSRIQEVSRLPRGEFIVKLENGQVWAQNDPKPRMNLKPGDEVVLSTGALGSFWLAAHSQRVRVSRVR